MFQLDLRAIMKHANIYICLILNITDEFYIIQKNRTSFLLIIFQNKIQIKERPTLHLMVTRNNYKVNIHFNTEKGQIYMNSLKNT